MRIYGSDAGTHRHLLLPIDYRAPKRSHPQAVVGAVLACINLEIVFIDIGKKTTGFNQ
jgi:hypothetical protein